MSYKELIEQQQKGHKQEEPLFMVGEQLKEIAEREPLSAELLTRDLQVKEMDLAAAARELQKYADEHHGSAKQYCITPAVAEDILRKFYGLQPAGAGVKPAEPTNENYIDLADCL